MEAGLLFSGGKDSSLAALILDEFYDVTLVSAHFEVTDAWKHARKTAEVLGFDFEPVAIDQAVAKTAVAQMVDDGFPRNGIQQVHSHALETVAAMEFDAIADGTRRDDRVPSVSRAQAQSLEDRHDVDYLAPLTGIGRRAVDKMVAQTLEIESGPSEEIRKGDYEEDLRALMVEAHGAEMVGRVFPDHTQTRVVARR
ncbi:alpha hydrolase [Haladaptatus sp. DYSN1]|uniref:DUF7411 family protein n=1 Tax=unclassified Haladaptatus TaxID=2622732 RepID=UPI0024069E26|nr:alpha hydrolase [Haladaptatus sp. DYSN1]